MVTNCQSGSFSCAIAAIDMHYIRYTSNTQTFIEISWIISMMVKLSINFLTFLFSTNTECYRKYLILKDSNLWSRLSYLSRLVGQLSFMYGNIA